MLRRRQPDLLAIIDDVGMDPRCAAAARFCSDFCELALEYAETVVGYAPPRYPRHVLREAACLIAQRQAAVVGKRACSYPERIRRHVLAGEVFDEDDTAWLCTTLSACLFVTEGSC